MADKPWVLITGATSPLGYALAQGLAKEGYALALHYHKKVAEAERLAEECRHLGVPVEVFHGDFKSERGLKLFIDSLAMSGISLTHLINNASLYLIAPLLSTSVEAWMALWQVNLTAPVLLTQAFANDIAAAGGSITNIGVAGLTRQSANSYSAAYSATKMALLTATRTLAKELSSKGARVNMISPSHLPHSLDHTAPHKIIPYSAIVHVLIFLLSESAHFITGQNIEVASGSYL